MPRKKKLSRTAITTRVETIPATYKTVTEQVLAKAESLRYEPIAIPLKTVKEEVLRSEGSALSFKPANLRSKQ